MKVPPVPVPDEVKGLVTTIKVLPYKGSNIYCRKFTGFEGGRVLYEWLIEFKGQIYTSYIIITLRKGQKEISENEEKNAVAMIFSGAVTTIDTLMDAELELAKPRVKETN